MPRIKGYNKNTDLTSQNLIRISGFKFSMFNFLENCQLQDIYNFITEFIDQQQEILTTCIDNLNIDF